MSGNFLARASALSLALVLAACGGDDSSSSLAGSGNSSGTGGGTSSSNTNDSSQAEVSVALGYNTGDSFIEGQAESDITDLSAGGQTKVRVFIVDKNKGNALVNGTEKVVDFTSNCVSTGEAEIVSPITTSSGVAETTYTARGCTPQDSIEAKVDGASAIVALNITPPSADRIVAAPLPTESIAPIGSGTTSRASEVRVSFSVVDENGDGLRGIDVNFSISGDDPSAETPVTLGSATATSSSGGEVSTLVIAGTSSTVVRIIATIETDEGTASTQSAPIAINSLIPVETGFTLAADNFLPDAQFTAGVPVQLSVYATDRNGQNIRGNTIINFTTDGGSVQPECILQEDGTCIVTWRSQAPWLTKPTITASTIGETTSGEVGTISQDLTLTISSSRDPQVLLSAGAEANQYCAITSVLASDGRIHPADQTLIEFKGTGLTMLSSKQSVTINGATPPLNDAEHETCIYSKRENDAVPGTLTVTVTTPEGEIAEDFLDI